MVDTGRKIIEGKRTLYFKRHYPDGRTRPVRLAATDFVAAISRAGLRGALGRILIETRPRYQNILRD